MIILKDLDHTFSNLDEDYLYENLNYVFEDKGLYFILGKSGCGKSTLLNIIKGIIKPLKGCVNINDIEITNLNKTELREFQKNNFSFVNQDFDLIDNLSIRDNLNIVLNIKGDTDNDIRIKEALEIVNLTLDLDKKVNTLSGGEKQRVAIARALLQDTSILLCDEPTGSLDSNNSTNIYEILKKISKEKLVIVVSHDVKNANKYADNILDLEKKNYQDVSKYQLINNGLTCKKTKLEKHYFNKLFKSFNCNKRLMVLMSVIVTLISTILGVITSFVGFNNKKIIQTCISNNINYFNIRKSLEASDGTTSWNLDSYMNNQDLEFIKKETGINNYDIEYAYFTCTEINEIDIGDNEDEFVFTDINGSIEMSEDEFSLYKLDLYGHLPQNDNEIAITKYYADLFVKYGFVDDENNKTTISTINDLINYYIKLEDSDNSYDFTICGIIDTHFDYQKLKSVYATESDILKVGTISEFENLANKNLHKLVWLNEGFVSRHYTASDDIADNSISAIFIPFNNKINNKVLNFVNKDVDNIYDVSSIFSYDDSYSNYEFYNQIADQLLSTNDYAKYITIGYFVTFAILVLINIGVIAYFFITIINKSKRNIAIFYNLGIDFKNIKNSYLAIECALITVLTLISILLSIVGNYIANVIINSTVIYKIAFNCNYSTLIVEIVSLIMLSIFAVICNKCEFSKITKTSIKKLLNEHS